MRSLSLLFCILCIGIPHTATASISAASANDETNLSGKIVRYGSATSVLTRDNQKNSILQQEIIGRHAGVTYKRRRYNDRCKLMNAVANQELDMAMVPTHLAHFYAQKYDYSLLVVSKGQISISSILSIKAKDESLINTFVHGPEHNFATYYAVDSLAKKFKGAKAKEVKHLFKTGYDKVLTDLIANKESRSRRYFLPSAMYKHVPENIKQKFVSERYDVPVPIASIMVSNRLSPKEIKKLQDAHLVVHEQPELGEFLKRYGVDRYVVPSEELLDYLGNYSKAAEKACDLPAN